MRVLKLTEWLELIEGGIRVLTLIRHGVRRTLACC